MKPSPTAATRVPIYQNLTLQVLTAITVGVLIGHFWPSAAVATKPLGEAFIRLVKMVIGPVVFLTLVTGISSMGDLKKVGRVGLKALIYFELMTTFALALGAWQARVEPHFLNNTLNAIKSLIRLDPDRARAYLVKFGEFFNETRGYAGESSITLGQELTQLRRYLDFQTLRFTDALRVRQDIPAELHGWRLPPRSLQTLVENALTHGFPAPTGLFELCVDAAERDSVLILKVRDNGRGIPPDRLADLGQRPVASEHGSGAALYQLAQALALAFGTRARLAIETRPGVGTEVTLTLPKRSEPW